MVEKEMDPWIQNVFSSMTFQKPIESRYGGNVVCQTMDSITLLKMN